MVLVFKGLGLRVVGFSAYSNSISNGKSNRNRDGYSDSSRITASDSNSNGTRIRISYSKND